MPLLAQSAETCPLPRGRVPGWSHVLPAALCIGAELRGVVLLERVDADQAHLAPVGELKSVPVDDAGNSGLALRGRGPY